MANVSIKVNGNEIRQAIKSRIIVPIAKTVQNPAVMQEVGNGAIRILDRYVPKKTGALRKSTHTKVRPKQVKIIWGDAKIGKTSLYAAYQHNSDDSNWRRTTPGTKSFWTEEVYPGTPGHTKLIKYTAKVIKKEVKRNGGR